MERVQVFADVSTKGVFWWQSKVWQVMYCWVWPVEPREAQPLSSQPWGLHGTCADKRFTAKQEQSVTQHHEPHLLRFPLYKTPPFTRPFTHVIFNGCKRKDFTDVIPNKDLNSQLQRKKTIVGPHEGGTRLKEAFKCLQIMYICLGKCTTLVPWIITHFLQQ